MSNISDHTVSYLLISSESQNWFAKAEQDRKVHGRTTQHSTARHNAEENKNEKMSQGRQGTLASAISYLILGLF